MTTPSASCPVGTVFYVMGSAQRYAVDYSDWVLRLCSARANGGRPYGEGVDLRPAEEALLEQLRSGELHPSLVEAPRPSRGATTAAAIQRRPYGGDSLLIRSLSRQ